MPNFVFPDEADQARIYDAHTETVAALMLAVDQFLDERPVPVNLRMRMDTAVNGLRAQHSLDSDDVMRVYNRLRQTLPAR